MRVLSLSVYGEATDLYYHVGILGTDRETALAAVIAWLSSVDGHRIDQDAIVEDPPLLGLDHVNWPSHLSTIEDRLQMVVDPRRFSLIAGVPSESTQTDGTADENIVLIEGSDSSSGVAASSVQPETVPADGAAGEDISIVDAPNAPAHVKTSGYQPVQHLVVALKLSGALAAAHREELRFADVELDAEKRANRKNPRNWRLPWSAKEPDIDLLTVRCVFHFLGAWPEVSDIKSSITSFHEPPLPPETAIDGKSDPLQDQEPESAPSSVSGAASDQPVDAKTSDTSEGKPYPNVTMFCLATLDDFSLRTPGAIEALKSLNQLLKKAMPTLPTARVMVACMDGAIRPAASIPQKMAPLDVVDFITDRPDKGVRVLRDLWSDWPALVFKPEYINMLLSEWRLRRPTLTDFQHSVKSDGNCLRLATFDRLGFDKKSLQPGVILSAMNLQKDPTDEDRYERNFSILFSDEVLPLRSLHIEASEDRWSLKSRRKKLGKDHGRWAPYRGWVPLMALFLGPSTVGNGLAKDWLFDDAIRNARP